MSRRYIPPIIYGLPALACSMFMLARTTDLGRLWEISILWLCVAAMPLLFVFAYPRFLFLDAGSPGRLKYAALGHGLGAVTTTTLFVIFSPFWKNPLRELAESALILIVPLAVLVVFLASAVALLLKNKSTLAVLAWILIWPYWLALALFFEGQFFQDTGVFSVYYFLCFLAPLLFAFAAGAVPFRPNIAHCSALVGLLTVPFLYYNLRDTGLGNVWIVFNQPNDRFSYYPPYAVPGICSVAFIALATTTGFLRLLPARWHFRNAPVSERTWPAGMFSLVMMAVWFSQSVLPYRIPGAVDYSDFPILQILHVEKKGLQFHETCVSISGYRWRGNFDLREAHFSHNDRRLLEYRFRENGAAGQLTASLAERIRAVLLASAEVKRESDIVKPVRAWNADRWYVNPAGGSLKTYSTANGEPPPKEIIDLFDDLQKLPQSHPSQSEGRDVCLGFCYDPLSAMGYLYANHRCFNGGHGVVCR